MFISLHTSNQQNVSRRRIGVPLVAFCLFGMVAARMDAGSTHTQVSKFTKDGNTYVFFSGADVASLNASEADLDQAQEFRDKMGAELLWARQDGKTWAMSNANLIGEAHKILDSMIDTSTQQDTAGEKQGELGRQQTDLGARQKEIGQQITAVKAEIRAASGQKAADLKERLRLLDIQQKELGKQQAEVGQQQAGFGKQQAELGEQQTKLAESNYMKLRTLVDQAIRNGLAEQIQP